MKFETNSLMQLELSRLNMEIIQSSYVYIDNKWNSEWNDRSSFSRVYLVTGGGGRIVCGGVETELASGNVYIIPPNTDFFHYCDGKMEKLYFHVRMQRYDRSDIFSRTKECIILENRMPQIEEMVRLYRESTVEGALELKTKLFIILCEALKAAKIPTEKIKTYPAVVKRVIRFIEKNPSYNMSASELAQKFFVSTSYLQKTFKSEVGISLGKYIHLQAIAATELRLRNTNESIASISQQFGFCDQFYFSRVFREHYGVPPSQYRKDIVQKSSLFSKNVF